MSSSSAVPSQQTKTRRIAIVGSRAVGKSSLTLQFVEGQFNQGYYPTIENTFTKPFSYRNQQYQLEIIDSAGQDEFSLISHNQAIGIHAYLFVFSITSRESFEIIKVIREKLLSVSSADFRCVIVGNKLDLMSQRQVSNEEGRELASKWKCPYVEASAKLNQNIVKAFELCLDEIDGIGNTGKCIVQ